MCPSDLRTSLPGVHITKMSTHTLDKQVDKWILHGVFGPRASGYRHISGLFRFIPGLLIPGAVSAVVFRFIVSQGCPGAVLFQCIVSQGCLISYLY